MDVYYNGGIKLVLEFVANTVATLFIYPVYAMKYCVINYD